MGTSKSYIPKSSLNNTRIKRAMNSYMNDNANVSRVVNRIGASLSDDTNSPTKSSVGRPLGNFISLFEDFKKYGIDKTLESNGLLNLKHLSGSDLINALLDEFLEENTILEDSTIRHTFDDTLENMHITNLEDLKNLDSKDFLVNFIIIYIQNTFLLKNSEYMIKKWGNAKKEYLVNEINKCIYDATHDDLIKGDLEKVNWNSEEGRKYIEDRCKDAYGLLELYGGE